MSGIKMSLTGTVTVSEIILKNYEEEVRLDYTSGILMAENHELYMNEGKIRSGKVPFDQDVLRFPQSFPPVDRACSPRVIV